MRSLFVKTAAVAALMTGVSGAAYATEGWYGRIDGGYSFDAEISDSDEEVELDDSWLASGGAGYAFLGGFRIEGELSYRQNEIDDLELDASAIMFNGYFDFNRDGAFQPYVGLGLGYGNLEVSDPMDSIEESGLAWQALAGVGFAVSERLTLDVGYRYFSMSELDFGVSDEIDYTHQAGTIGLRWQFAAAAPPPTPLPPPAAAAPPPPPPPPPSAACPTSDFVVYFEWDRSNLNQAALETIDSAVTGARACNLNEALVIGHTDTSGSTQYNAGLSERRASVVRDALVARGLPTTSVRTEAHGETDLARATRDGVREPLNRRAAVSITFR